MKKIYSTSPIIALVFFFSISLTAQFIEDPVKNVYKVGGSPELFISYSTTGNTYSRLGVLDVPENLNDIVKKEDAFQYKYLEIYKTASAAGDFNGDGRDEVVTICNNTSGGIRISIPLYDPNLLMQGEREYTVEKLNTLDYTRVRICTGNFDDDYMDEFAVCFGGSGETIHLLIFETNKDLEITLLKTFKEIAYYDHFFDITASDMDLDGIDEIVMVKNEVGLKEKSTSINPPIFIATYDLYVIDYDFSSGNISITYDLQNVETENQAPGGDNWFSTIRMNELRIACGDLNNDGRDEIVVGWSNYYSYTRSSYCCGFLCLGTCYTYYYCDMVFVNTFAINSLNAEIENVQNLYVTHNSFSTYSGYEGQHIALTLMCEKLDNMGRPEVLINSAGKLCVLGPSGPGMELEKRVEIGGPEGTYLGIGGNEAFVVADLNPDTIKLNFNKEVVLLLSNKICYDQLFKAADVPYFGVLQIDTINSDTLAFKPQGPPYGLAFDDVDIEVSCFTAGDFDRLNSEVYYVGTPEVIPISEMQYPLIILNAPPVHFDVLNGTTHDICNAFLADGEPPFSAQYYTEVGEEKTTGIEIDNSMGFSSELKVYAMAGGNGFENSVNNNWERGVSYYQSKSHNTLIEEAKEVYTEDYVLYSCLDYLYYRYPVYDESGKRIGKIGVLNPVSDEFKSVWGSANNWEHPGYIFNHEPGNILSYRSLRNTADFCFTNETFSFCEFSRVPVTHTGNGSFKFTYENISSSGNSCSFSAGVGMDMFTKVGFEATVTAELSFLGLGGSIATDVRVGTSSELSLFYNSSSMRSHSTELRNSFQIDGLIGRLSETYDPMARYFITPYIYRSQSGALVLDYLVDLDQSNKEWWEDHYGQKVDLAFILPWRYSEEKGGGELPLSKKQKTSEIQFYPPIAHPGDTVCIATRVHNYSLMTFENEINVSYFMGDPEIGGFELTDINGVKGSSKFSTMIYGAPDANLDFEEYLVFNWKIPDTTSCSPRIYAVIDPENDYDEIHENNNKAWNLLHIYECGDCGYPEVGIEERATQWDLVRIYPNPARERVYAGFTLATGDLVTLEIHTLTGQKVFEETRAYDAGEHTVPIYTGNLENGMYICELSTGRTSGTTKIVVSK